MSLSSLKDYLDKHNVKYIVVSHSPAYTAQGIAALAHIPGKELAKTVVVKLDGKLVMAVLPASFHVDLGRLKEATKAKAAELASEDEFKHRFPECETGAMPPFGNLYGLPTNVDKNLAEQDYIVFEAGTHTDAIKISYRDYEKIVKPKVEDLAVKLQPMKGA